MTGDRALVLDGRALSSLAVARSLGGQGYTVDSGDTFRTNVTALSKYIDKRITYPSVGESPEAFLHSLLSELNQREYDVLIPTRDETTQFVSEHREELSELTNVYVPPPSVLSTFVDKGETIKLARECGVPTPKTYFPEEQSLEEIKAQVSYPILIRPRDSAGSRGITRVESPDEFDDAYKTVDDGFDTPMIQEFVEKSGYTTACVLLDKTQSSIAQFSYERQKEYPLSGGPTVVGESTDDSEAKEYARELLQAGDWYGSAEVEFILDQGGTPRLLEVNPRFWMPVQLAISAGVDFPGLVAALAQGEAVSPVESYETGLTYRWVLPNEVLHTAASGDIIRGIRDVAGSAREETCYGSLSRSDPLPVLGTVVQSLVYLTDTEKRKSVLNRSPD